MKLKEWFESKLESIDQKAKVFKNNCATVFQHYFVNPGDSLKNTEAADENLKTTSATYHTRLTLCDIVADGRDTNYRYMINRRKIWLKGLEGNRENLARHLEQFPDNT